MKSYTEEQRIAARYKQFGVTERLVKEIVQSGLKNGISCKAALVGTRLALASYSSDWYDQEPEWVKYGQSDSSEVEVYGHTREEVADDDDCYYDDNYDGDEDDDRYYEDEDDDYQEIVQVSPDNKPLDGGASSDIPEEKFDPFVLVGKKNEDKFDPFVFVEKKNEDKFAPFIFLKKSNK